MNCPCVFHLPPLDSPLSSHLASWPLGSFILVSHLILLWSAHTIKARPSRYCRKCDVNSATASSSGAVVMFCFGQLTTPTSQHPLCALLNGVCGLVVCCSHIKNPHVIESILIFNISAWFGTLNLTLHNMLSKISSKIIGQEQQSLATTHNIKVLRKGTMVCTDPSHSLSFQYTLLPSGRRYRSLPLMTKRASFLSPSTNGQKAVTYTYFNFIYYV